MSRPVYQLVAHGRSLTFGSAASISSKKVYASRSAAERAIPSFQETCLENRGSFSDLSSVDHVQVLELELVEDDGHGRYPDPA